MFRAWLRTLQKPKCRQPIRNASRTTKLAMEALEDRLVPTAIAWASNASGNWDVAENWSSKQVPTSADDVTINQPGTITVTIPDLVDASVNSIQSSTSDTLSLTGRGTLTIVAASQLDGAYVQTSGTLTATAGLTLTSGASQWSNGAFHGSVTNTGTLTLGSVAFSNSSEVVFGTLVNAGTIIDSNDPAVSFGFQLASGGTLENQAGGLVDFQTDTGMSNLGVFNNAGTIRKSVKTGTTTIGVALNNAPGGILEVATGTLSLTGGGTSTGGAYVVSANAALLLNANATMNGNYTGSGAGSVQLIGGTVQVASGVDTTFNFPAGLFHWTNGTIAAGNGIFTNVGFLTLTGATQNATETLSGTLTNAGTITDQNDPTQSFGLRLEGSGVLDNLTGGLIDFQSDLGVFPSTFNGAGVIKNAGTIRKSTSVGATQVLLPINNVPGSTLEADTGTLELHGGGASTGGAFIARQNATLILTTDHSDVGIYNGIYTGSGAGTVQVLAGTIQVATGADTTFNFPAGLFFWGGGAIAAGSGHFTNAGFLTISNVNNAAETLSGTLTNAGTIIDSNTPNDGFSQGLLLDGSATLNNLATGLFEFQTDSFLEGSVFAGTGTFVNAGTIRKSAGSGITSLSTLLNNAPGGIIEVDTGTIQVLGGGTSAGGAFIVKQNAALAMHSTGAKLTLNGNYTGSGAGTVQLVAGTVQVATGGDTTFNFPAGLFLWEGGTLAAGSGRFTNAGFLTVSNVNNAVETLSGTLMNAGTITDTNTPNAGFSQGLLLDGSATLNNLATGLFDFQTDSFVEGTVFAGTGTFVNAGTIRKSAGAGISQIAVPLNNNGTVEAAVGTLQIVGSITQVSGKTLGGGNWVVDAGSTLDLQSAPGLTTNNATVTFNGIGAKIPKLNVLAVNDGALKFLGGADFSFAGDLINSGTLVVGTSTTTMVTGTYTQTAEGTLGIQVGGTPASGQFGQLNIAGQATLNGTLAIGLVSGFGPTGGQAFPIVNFASHVGDFAAVTGLGDGRRNFFSETTNPTGAVLNALISSADLAVTQIDPLPPVGVVGQTVTIHYTVQNISGAPAVGSWVDSVYLSSDGVFGSNDRLLGRVTHTGDVAANGTYQGVLTAPLPAVLGGFHVIVFTDSRGLVPDTNRSNNVKVTADAIDATVPSLILGGSVSGTIAADQDLLYRVDVGPGQDVQFTGDFGVVNAAELYERYQAPADRSTFDQLAYTLDQSRQQLVVTAAQGGTYYVLLHGREASGAGQTFTLTASVLPIGIRSIEPTRGSNAGSATVTVRGDHFSPNTTLTLVSGNTQRAATNLVFKDSSTLFATFDLTGLTSGAFDVRAEDGSRTLTDAAAFRVTAGVVGHVEYFLNSPEIIRPGQPGTTVTISYLNLGDTDVGAPLILLQSDNARFRLPGQPGWNDDEISLLATNANGPAGILPPGASGTIIVEFQPKRVGIHIDSTFSLLAPASDTAFDWSAIKKSLQPVGEPDDAWDVVFANLTNKLGATVGSVETALDLDATYLGSLGEATPAFSRMLDYEVQQADDYGAITARYRLGALGRGIPDPTDLAAITDGAGNVVLRSSGLVSSFTRRPDGSFQGEPGDFDTLTLVNGAYQLREKDGTLSVYNPDGTFDYRQDPSGNRVTAVFTGSRLTGLIDSSGNMTTYNYNANGRIGTIIDPEGRVTTLTYDVAGERLLSVTDSRGTVSITYVTGQGAARENAQASIKFQDGTNQFFSYDVLGRLVHQESDGGASAINISFDAVGRVTIIDAAGGKTVVQPNDFGQIAQVIDAIGRVTRATFDVNHQQTGLSSIGGQTTIAYDAMGNPVSTTDSLGLQSILTYDSTFNGLTGYVDPLGHTLVYGRDGNGQITSQTFADGSSEQFRYDDTGRITSTVDRNGQSIGYTYDDHDLLLRQDFADGTHNDYSYDAHRNLKTITDSTGITTYTYDTADRMTAVVYPDGKSLIFTYDTAGRRSSMTDPIGAGFTTNYSYDAAGRLQKLTDGPGALIAAYSYDAVGRLSRTDNGNGTATTYTYNAAGAILSLVNLAADGTAVQSRFDYVYDALGRPVTMATLQGIFTYTYDADNQLTSVNAPGGRIITYQYDAAGNRISAADTGITTAYAVNSLNEYTTSGPVSYTYDAAGNMRSRTDSTGTTSYRYDLQGKLAGIVSPTDTWSFSYNALGQRVSVTHNGQETDYLIDPTSLGDVAAEYSPGSGLVAHYIQGLGLAGRVDAAGAAAYYGFDGTGNTAQLTGAGGATLDSYSYLPFGEQLSASGTTPNPFTFVGRAGVQDDGSGLYYMRARYYSPSLGRFTSADPMGLKGGDSNLYRYVNNNPVEQSDPSGNCFPVIPVVVEITAPLVIETEVTLATYLGALFETFGSERTIINVAGTAGYVAFLGGPGSAQTLDNCPILTPVLPPRPYSVHLTPQSYSPLRLTPPSTPIRRTVTKQGLSGDPNEITGPAGFGGQGFVTLEQSFPYTIFFQNKPEATAPAQVVVVTQQLDPNLDLSTFQLGDISFGTVVIPVPAGRTSFSTRYDARASLGVFVDVTAGVNLATGLATWTFTSIDPTTLDLPIAVLEGFLPPDVTAPEGDGFVSYTVRPKAGLTSGTVINAKATIVFDINAPLDTAPILNTIDDGAPTSSVQSLPGTTVATTFALSWAGTDDSGGSGIAHFDVFVSDNGSAFTSLLQGTTATTTAFTGVVGHTYGFYSIATDNLGHVQTTPAGTQASTQIVAPDTMVPTSSVSVLPVFSRPSFTVSWSGQDEAGGSGIATFTVYVSDNGGAFSAWQVATTLTSAVFSGSAGHTYAFYSVATDHAGNVQPTPAAAQANTSTQLDTPNKLYIDAVYRDLLGRASDVVGLNYWSGQLEQGGARATLINLIDHSAEYFGTIIKPAYQQFLGRTPDAAGLAFWIESMSKGLTDEHLEAGFIGSIEYYNHAGGTDKGWVDAMYQNLLGRHPDSQGEAFWVGQLAEGVSRASVAYGFAASGEREGQHVSANYQKYLGRGAGQSEIDFWIDQFVNHDKTNEDVVTGFVSSDEYFRKHTSG